VVAVKVTGEFTTRFDGRTVKLVVSGGGVLKTVSVWELVAVSKADDESFAVSVTVNDRALA
jgi:hypothetical protein